MRQQAQVPHRTIDQTGHLAASHFSFLIRGHRPAAVLYYVRKLPEGSELIKSDKKLDAYCERLAERPSFKATQIRPPPPGR